jgi:Cys-tRNA(Pro)/Cys-tRNA(Cys) deacylase
MKTNAMRILDTLGIQYEIREYEVDPDDLSAERIARDIGLPPEQVFKTLVARGDRHGVLLAVVPADAEVDFKALARQSDNRTVELVSLKEVQPLTGYIRGGVTALAGKRDYPVHVDEQIQLFDVVAVSAGVRGKQMVLAPEDYVRATGATIGPICRTAGG